MIENEVAVIEDEVMSKEEMQLTDICFVVSRDKLLLAMSQICGVVERRNAVPILANVKLDISQGMLKLAATDMDRQVTIDIEISKVTNHGSTTVPAHLFHDIIRKIPNGFDIDIKIDDARAHIRSGQSRFNLSVLNPSSFPSMDDLELNNQVTLNVKDCYQVLNKAKLAISNDEVRYYLNGLYLHFKNDTLHGVATDGHRLFCSMLKTGVDMADVGIILPKKSVYELLKIIAVKSKESDLSEVSIDFSENRIRFHCGNVDFYSKLIDGKFPDYKQVIPAADKASLKLQIAVNVLSEVVDRVSTISSDKTRAIIFVYDKCGKLEISSSAPDNGNDAVESIEVVEISNKLENGLSIGINSRYVLDVLSIIDDEEIYINIYGNESSILIQGKSDDTSEYVIMPLRV